MLNMLRHKDFLIGVNVSRLRLIACSLFCACEVLVNGELRVRRGWVSALPILNMLLGKTLGIPNTTCCVGVTCSAT